MDQDNDRLIRKAKVLCTGKAKRRIHSLLPIRRQMFSLFQESRGPACKMITWEDKHHNRKCPPFLLLFLSF